MIHVLWNEAFSVAIVQQTIVREGVAGEGIDCGIAYDDSQLVLSRLQLRGQIDRVWRVPYYACSLAIDVDLSCFPHR